MRGQPDVRPQSVLSPFARSLRINLVRFLRLLKDLLLIQDALIAAHASDITTTDASWICICVYAHDGVTLLDSNVIGKFH